MAENWHICRSWNPPDPFAPECGCTLLPCGHVDADEASEKGCTQHGIMAGKSIRSGHRPRFCPSASGSRDGEK